MRRPRPTLNLLLLLHYPTTRFYPKRPRVLLQVCVFAFDCLYINGRSLLREPLEERRKALYGALNEIEGEMQFATAKTSKDVEELQVRGEVGA